MSDKGLVVFDYWVGIHFLEPTDFKVMKVFMWVIWFLPHPLSNLEVRLSPFGFAWFLLLNVLHIKWGIGGLLEVYESGWISVLPPTLVLKLRSEKKKVTVLFSWQRDLKFHFGGSSKYKRSNIWIQWHQSCNFPQWIWSHWIRAILAIHLFPGKCFKFYT